MKNGPGLRAWISLSLVFTAAAFFSVMSFARGVRVMVKHVLAQCYAFPKSRVYLFSLARLQLASLGLLGIPV